jgi:hypothetical protein
MSKVRLLIGCHEIVADLAAAGTLEAAMVPRSLNTGSAAFKPFCDRREHDSSLSDFVFAAPWSGSRERAIPFSRRNRARVCRSTLSNSDTHRLIVTTGLDPVVHAEVR